MKLPPLRFAFKKQSKSVILNVSVCAFCLSLSHSLETFGIHLGILHTHIYLLKLELQTPKHKHSHFNDHRTATVLHENKKEGFYVCQIQALTFYSPISQGIRCDQWLLNGLFIFTGV